MSGKVLFLGEKEVSEKVPPYMIAEIGINHNGDIQIAKRLIDAGFATRWNCVKFQKREPDIAVPDAEVAESVALLRRRL